MLEFLSTLTHTVGHHAREEVDRVQFRLMDTNYEIPRNEWCTIFGFVNNDGHIRYSHHLLNPTPLSFGHQISVYKPIPKGSSLESPAIWYFYYVIANTLQARGEFTKLNEEDMIILAKAASPNSNMTLNLGAMLLLYLSHQAHQARGNITCGGVITILTKGLNINLGNLRPLNGNRHVSLSILRSAGMIITRNGRIFIRIRRVRHLLLTPMPNMFSIEDGILHYNAHGEDEDEDPEVEMPEDVEVEEDEPEEAVQRKNNEEGDGPYATYTDVHDLGDSLSDMSDLSNALRDYTEAMMS